MSDLNASDSGNGAILELLRQQGQQLHRISNTVQGMSASISKIDSRLAVIESKDYASDIHNLKEQITKIQAHIDAQTGIVNFFTWISKNIIWMAMIVAATFAAFGYFKQETVNVNPTHIR